MLGRTKKTSPSASSNTTAVGGDKLLNSIVQGTQIEGVVHAGNDIRIDGKLKGTLECTGKVVIGKSGEIEGEVVCQDAMVEGRFTGKLRVKDMLNIRESAVVNGDVATDKLIVQSGAVFNVQCLMGGQTVKGFEKENGRVGNKEKDVLKLG